MSHDQIILDPTDQAVPDRQPPAPDPAPAPRRRRSTVTAGQILPVLAAFVIAIGAWYVVSYVLLQPSRRFLVPPPHQVVSVAILDWTHLQPMLSALWLTARVALAGLLTAAVLGISIAVVMGRSRVLERSIYPYAVILQTVPILALVPLIGLWFGYGFLSRTIVCVIIALFPLIANTLFGLQSVPGDLHDLFTLAKASPWDRLWKLELPYALPSIMTGVRTAAGLAVIGAVIGDMYFTQGQPGIGTLLDTYRARLQSEDLFAAIGMASLFGVTIFGVFTALQRVTTGSWHNPDRST